MPSKSLSANKLKFPKSLVMFALTIILFLALMVITCAAAWRAALILMSRAALMLISWAARLKAWSIRKERSVLDSSILPAGACKSPETCTLPLATIFITPFTLTICVAFTSPV